MEKYLYLTALSSATEVSINLKFIEMYHPGDETGSKVYLNGRLNPIIVQETPKQIATYIKQLEKS
jgi:hypothetical protein